MAYGFLDPWHLFLPRGAGHVVSLMGSGGKTSLMRALLDVLTADGASAAVTTTTRTEVLHWPDLEVLEWDRVEAGARPRGGRCCIHAGVLDGDAEGAEPKWEGLDPEQVDRLGGICPQHVILAEVDGAAEMPVKLHRDDEPLWPARTSLAVVCAGLSAIGRPAAECLHRQGRAPGADPCRSDPARIWDWDCMEHLLIGPGGYRERVPEGVPAVLALLQMGSCDDSIGLFDFLGRVMSSAGFPVVVLGELGSGTPEVRTAYLSGEGPEDDS